MINVEAYILNYKDIKDFDRKYTLLTKEFGKIEAICKSVLKPSSKLAGHLEPVNFSWLEIIETKNGWQIIKALENNSFLNLRNNLEAFKISLSLAQFLDEFVYGLDIEIFDLWQDFLNKLNSYSLEKEINFNSSGEAMNRSRYFLFIFSGLIVTALIPFQVFSAQPDSAIKLKAVKVERGPISTEFLSMKSGNRLSLSLASKWLSLLRGMNQQRKPS